MYIPTTQSVIVAGLALTGTLMKPSEVASGEILDYAVEKCLDGDGNQRCSKPFLVSKSTCYNIEWSTEGALSHTTVEVRDAGSNELVYYRDTNGEWTPEKGELVYLDFKPKVWKTGNDTVIEIQIKLGFVSFMRAFASLIRAQEAFSGLPRTCTIELGASLTDFRNP